MVLDVVLFVLGAALVLVTLYDLAATTISLSSARGPLASRLSAVVWGMARRTSGTRIESVQRAAGPVLLLAILMGWLVTLTLGWTMLFSVGDALESTAEAQQQGSSIRGVDAVFFVFGNLIGRGSSSLSPTEAWWSTLEALMSLTGVALLTLAIAWILPVVAAVVQKRALAAQISSLGGTPQEIVTRGWNGRTLGDLNLQLLPLIPEVALLAQRHLAYPVIHYFHSAAQRTAIGPRLAALDEALTLIDAAGLDAPDTVRDTNLDTSTTEPLRQAISDYLATLETVFIRADHDAPPPPDPTPLVDAGVVDGSGLRDAVAERCDQLRNRRSLLAGYVRHDGWSWEDIATSRDARDERPDETD